VATTNDPSRQGPPAGDEPEPFPGILPPPKPFDELTEAEFKALSHDQLEAYYADEVVRGAAPEHLPPALKEAFRLYVRERMQEGGKHRYMLPSIAQPPEPAPKESALEVEDEAARRLRWQEQRDAKRSGYAPSEAEVEAARAAARRNVAELQRAALVDEEQLAAARDAHQAEQARTHPTP
jgi:hypothetical protein